MTDRPTNKPINQASKHSNKQPSKQASKQATTKKGVGERSGPFSSHSKGRYFVYQNVAMFLRYPRVSRSHGSSRLSTKALAEADCCLPNGKLSSGKGKALHGLGTMVHRCPIFLAENRGVPLVVEKKPPGKPGIETPRFFDQVNQKGRPMNHGLRKQLISRGPKF